MKATKKTTEFKKEFLADKNQIPMMQEFLKDKMILWKIEEQKRNDIILAADEAATNIIMHAYGKVPNGKLESEKKIESLSNNRERKFSLILRKNNKLLQIVLEDEGCFCDLTQVKLPDINTYQEQKKIGGFGIALIKALMDKFSYHCRNGKNLTKLVKKI